MKIETLFNILRRLKPDIANITQDTALEELGLSSLDMMVIICELEQMHDLAINIEALKNIKTVEQLYQAVTESI